MQPPFLKKPELLGLVGVLSNQSIPADDPDIEEDIEGEQETMVFPGQADDEDEDTNNKDGSIDTSAPQKSVPRLPSAIPSIWKETISHAAKGVTDNTHSEYIRYVRLSFLISVLYILTSWKCQPR